MKGLVWTLSTGQLREPSPTPRARLFAMVLLPRHDKVGLEHLALLTSSTRFISSANFDPIFLFAPSDITRLCRYHPALSGHLAYG